MMHKIIIDGREDEVELSRYYRLEKSMYEQGEMVNFSFPTATDTSYRVTSAQVKIRCEDYSVGGISKYSFIMPDTDVEIDVEANNTMVNPYMNGSALPSMGMMGTGMMGMSMMEMMTMGMNGSDNAEAVTNPDPYPWEGKPRFCSECGASTKASNKFCSECGAPLLPKE